MKLLISFFNLMAYHMALYCIGFYWQIVSCLCSLFINYRDRAECDMMIYDRNVRDYFKNNFCLIIYQLTAFITNPQIYNWHLIKRNIFHCWYLGHIKEIHVIHSMAMPVETYNDYNYFSVTKWHRILVQAHVIGPVSGSSDKREERYTKW